MSDHLQHVKNYYERNTKKFLKFGHNQGATAIHAALWPEGIQEVHDALNVAHQLVSDIIMEREMPTEAVADLGCGVGSALFYLANILEDDLKLYGLTLGTPIPKIPTDLSSRLRIIEGDFHHSNELLPPCDLAFCIEAIAHSNNIPLFLDSASKLLNSSGTLVLIDDFVKHDQVPSSNLNCYRDHWLVPGVQPLQKVIHDAESVGFKLVNSLNLTPWLRLNRPRDRLIRMTAPLWGWTKQFSYYTKSLVGGDARQKCLISGELNFMLLCFEKV